MLSNRYLRRLVRTYSEVVIDEAKIDEIAEKAAALRPEAVGIRKADLAKVATEVIEAFEKAGIDIDSMPSDVLMSHILNLFENIDGKANIMSDEVHENASVALGTELELMNNNRSGYRHGYGKSNRSFSSNDTFNKVMKALAMAGIFWSSLPFTNLNASEAISHAANNPETIERIIEKTMLENTTSKDSVIKYRKNIEHDDSIIEKIKPALDKIKRYFTPNVYEIYTLFEDAGAVIPLPENDTLDAPTRIAYRITKSAKIIYNKYRRSGDVRFDTLLEKEGTEIAARHIVFAAIAYNVLHQIDYGAHKLTPAQIEQLMQELYTGKYEVDLKNDDKTIVINTTGDIDMEFRITTHSIEVVGGADAVSRMENSQYRDIVLANFKAYKCAIVPVKGSIYDIYVLLPVPIKKQDGTYYIHEIAFKVRCDLEVYSYMQSSSGLSLIQPTSRVSQLRNRRTQLFRRKKKYDWM